MGCCKITSKDIFGYIVVQTGSVLFLVSFFTPDWLLPSSGDYKYGVILKGPKDSAANELSSVYDPEELTEDGVKQTYIATLTILSFASLLLTIGSLLQLITCVVCCCRFRIKAASTLHLLSGLLILIGDSVFTAMIILTVNYEGGEPLASNFGWSFYMNWCSGLIVIIGSMIEKKVTVESYEYEDP